MTSHSIAYYEEQFKIYIMQIIVGEKTNCLDFFLHEVINEHEEDYKKIHDAYLKVKKELVG